VWFSPQKSIYYNQSVIIPDPGAGRIWTSYMVYDLIFVSGHQAAQMTGTWEVDIYYNGTKLLTQTFTLNATVPTSRLTISDSAISATLNSTSKTLINRSLSISVNDPSVYTWVNFTYVPSPSHNVTFVWLTPQKTLYFNTSITIPDPGAGKFWYSYSVYDDIFVQGHQAAQMTGTWEVDIYVDGTLILRQPFTIQ